MYIRFIITMLAIFITFISKLMQDGSVKDDIRKLLSNRKRDNYAEEHSDIIKKHDNKYKLFNKHVSCEYSPLEVVFRYKSLENPNQSAYAQMSFKCFDMKECVKFLDFVMFSFNKNTDFSGLDYVFSTNKNFMIVSKTNPSVEKKEFVQQNQVFDEKININKASEEEIAKLPGVNIIRAKKVIQYRILHNGFKDINEFMKIAGVKSNFREIVEKNIMLGRYVQKNIQSDERQIDF